MRCLHVAILFALVAFCQTDRGGCETVDYLRDIRPILSDNCYACHGPDEESREANLRLDSLDTILNEEDDEVRVIVPGDAAASTLIHRVYSKTDSEVMPPPESGKSLTSDQISLLRQWVEEGASWSEHWSFVTPKRPKVPTNVSDSAIDYFIRRTLDERGLKPAVRAAKPILLRRVTFDLTGLPPTIAELDAFLADDGANAYERVVDRLLSSPHYGEHMARFWLDAARYGDTHGLHLDNYREMWPYRDWVINAFNRNMPYDQFVIEQLAGDLLENPTLDQRVATGFCRAHVTTNEGGSIEQEVFTRNVIDRVSTFGTVFLGLTLECSSCHDHKFDPVSQREFYQLFAFFNSLDGPAMDGNVKDPEPVISVPSDEQAEVIRALEEQVESLRRDRQMRRAKNDPDYEDWLQSIVERSALKQTMSDLHVSDGLVVHCDFDRDNGNAVTNHAQPGKIGKLIAGAKRVEGRTERGLQFAQGSHLDLGNVGSFNDNEPFSFGLWVKPDTGRNRVVLGKTDAQLSNRGYELSLLDGRVTAKLSRRQPGYIIKVTTIESLVPKNEWHHVFVTYDGSKRASGVTIYVDGKAQPVTVWSDALRFKGGIRNKKPLLVGTRDQGRGFAGSVDDVRVYGKRLTDAQARAVFLENQLEFAITTAQPNWTTEQAQRLEHFFMLNHDEEFRRLTEELSQRLVQLSQAKQAVPTTLVYRELEKPRDAYVLLRGEYDKPGEPVDRKTPELLPPMSDNWPRNRLGLARWLVDDENPLMARVSVNRFWQQFFGVGIVKTSEDFGNQGDLPSHPDLLDWLAVEFRESKWNVKSLVKSMVMSRTYQQSSRATSESIRTDPDNRILSRGPRFRLDAEMLRDQALAVSGLLVPRVGGPSVKPPQPPGLWLAVGFSSSNTVQFVADTDPNEIYRRSLYVFYKRTSTPPQMSTFDAPSRESSCVRRERTNTPLQSLLLMNDPQYIVAARALARKTLAADLESDRQRAARMYRMCTLRAPDEQTIDELVMLYDDQYERYQSDTSAAQALLSVLADHDAIDDSIDTSRTAAWTLVANLILNLDEVVTKN